MNVPRKPTLSASKLSTFLNCPTKYMWTYVDPRGRQFMGPRSYFSFGTSLHSVLQQFHSENAVGVKTQEEALAALDESWIEAGYGSAEEMADAFGEGREIISKYVEAVLKEDVKHRTIFVEKQFRHDLGDFVLIGRIDRLDELEDGTLEVVDYKTGRDDVTNADVANDTAMSVYQLLVSRNFPGVAVRAKIIALRTNRNGVAQASPEALDELEFAIRELGQQILNTNWEDHFPVRKVFCENCDFRRLCARHPGFLD